VRIKSDILNIVTSKKERDNKKVAVWTDRLNVVPNIKSIKYNLSEA
jgi:hypothetical protein